MYRCTKIVAHAVTYDSLDGLNDVDFALLKLDRPATGRTPLAIRQAGMVPDDANFTTIGSPLGLPVAAISLKRGAAFDPGRKQRPKGCGAIAIGSISV